MKINSLVLTAALCAALILPSLSAAAAQTAGASSLASALASQTGAIAGAAIFCQIDEDKQEIFFDRAQARIALSAVDDVDLVVAKIAFSNEKNHASAIEPEGGCDQFVLLFAAHISGLE